MKDLKLMVWVLVINSIICAAQGQKVADAVWRSMVVQGYHDEEGEILFYGKVVDQFTNPVVGADVEVSVPVVNLLGAMSYDKRSLETDTDGNFEVSSRTYGATKLKGHDLYIKEITKDGYGGNWCNGSNSGFSFALGNRFQPDPQHPVVYQLRKKLLPPAFLFQETDLSLESRVAASAWTNGYDFIKRHRFDDTHRLVFNGEPVFPDIQCKATFNTNDGTWTVTLMPGNTNGGIIASEQMLYEAPETGYHSEYVFTPEDRPQQVKMPHLYLKSREPAIYTRIDIKYLNANKEFFRLSGEAVTNPYGERNLEQATDLPWAVTKQLTDEVEAAFRENKRPAPPDLPKLIQGAKAQSGEK
ncbi:MAG: hypothetical protein U1F65_06245 [Verrucomicrobiota bacterium]